MWFEPPGWFIPLFSGFNRKCWFEPVQSGLNHAAGSNHFWLVQTRFFGLNQPKAVRTSGLDQTIMWSEPVKSGTSPNQSVYIFIFHGPTPRSGRSPLHVRLSNQGRTTDIWTSLWSGPDKVVQTGKNYQNYQKTSPIWFRPLLRVQATKTWSIPSFSRLLSPGPARSRPRPRPGHSARRTRAHDRGDRRVGKVR